MDGTICTSASGTDRNDRFLLDDNLCVAFIVRTLDFAQVDEIDEVVAVWVCWPHPLGSTRSTAIR